MVEKFDEKNAKKENFNIQMEFRKMSNGDKVVKKPEPNYFVHLLWGRALHDTTSVL